MEASLLSNISALLSKSWGCISFNTDGWSPPHETLEYRESNAKVQVPLEQSYCESA